MRINGRFTTGERIAPGERFIGDSEGWTHIQIFRSDRPLPPSAAIPAHGYYSGPGRGFAHPASVQHKGRFTFVTQVGGLDI